MKQKMVRLSDEVVDVLDRLSNDKGMSNVEIIQKGILAIAVANDIPVDGVKVVKEREKYRFWTTKERSRLRELVDAGMKYQDIADELGRTYDSVTMRVYKEGLNR